MPNLQKKKHSSFSDCSQTVSSYAIQNIIIFLIVESANVLNKFVANIS